MIQIRQFNDSQNHKSQLEMTTMFNPRKLGIFFFYFSLLFSQFAVSHPASQPLASLSLGLSLSHLTPPLQVWEFLYSSRPAAGRNTQQPTSQ